MASSVFQGNWEQAGREEEGEAAEEDGWSEGGEISDSALALVDLDGYGFQPADASTARTAPRRATAISSTTGPASLAAANSAIAAVPTVDFCVTPLTLESLMRHKPPTTRSSSSGCTNAAVTAADGAAMKAGDVCSSPVAQPLGPTAAQLQTLHEYFGHTRFRPKQWDIISAVLAGRDVCCIMATGYGKSLCFQFPALCIPGALAVVVCPLISLMEDQVMGLAEAGIPACVMGGVQQGGPATPGGAAAVADVLAGVYRVVYMTPEWVQAHDSTLATLHRRQRVAVVAIDEAHCVSQWGHDFRPAYRSLATLRQHLPGVPMMALTATATPVVRDDITRNLQLRLPLLCQTSFDRPNLYLAFGPRTNNAITDLQPLMLRQGAFAYTFEGATIVYCATRKRTDEVAGQLRDHGVACAAYHAGLNAARRREVHHQFLRDELVVCWHTFVQTFSCFNRQSGCPL